MFVSTGMKTNNEISQHIEQLVRTEIAAGWGRDRASGAGRYDLDEEGRLTEAGRYDLIRDLIRAHSRAGFDHLPDRLYEEVICSFEEGYAMAKEEATSSSEETESVDMPTTVEDLRKFIHNMLATPYAWEKFGLGGSPVGPVSAYCRDRSAQIAQALSGLLPGLLPVEGRVAAQESCRLDLVCRGFGRSCGDSISGLPKDLFECGWRGNTVNAICPKCRLAARQSAGG